MLFKLGNDDGYIQNRIRQVRMERRKVKILQDTFPEKSKDFELSDWANTAAASKIFYGCALWPTATIAPPPRDAKTCRT